MLQKLVM